LLERERERQVEEEENGRRRWKKKRIQQFVRREQRIDIVGCVIEIGVNTGEHKYIYSV